MDIENNNQQHKSNPSIPEETTIDNPVYKQKVSFFPIGIVVILIALVAGGFLLYKNMQPKTVPSNGQIASKNRPTPSQPSSFQTLQIINTDLNDNKSILYFADANKLYKKDFAGSDPQEIATLPHNISSISLLSNGAILINTDNSKFEKVIIKKSGDADYKQTFVGYGYWLLKADSNKPEQIDAQNSQALSRLNNTASEKIYTKELSNGQAEILSDALNGKAPTRIGLLKEKLIRVQVCEIGDNCLEMKYPAEFYPSANGDYLLNKPSAGGGLVNQL